jgi:hypothetical protein
MNSAYSTLTAAIVVNEGIIHSVPKEAKLAFWLQITTNVLSHSIMIYMKNKPHILYLQEKSKAK